LALALALAQTGGCPGDEPPPEAEPWVWELPVGFPEPFVPPENPMSAAKVALGRHLFYEKRLSVNESSSCGSCHEQARGFADGQATPVGATGDAVPRNSMALVNIAYMPTYTWVNPTLLTLEAQALVPLFGEHPLELGVTGHEEEILGRLRADPRYVEMFAAAFPAAEEPLNFDNVVFALASFERTMISGNSDYDKYVYGGDAEALSAGAKRGMALFFSERLECYHCHGGINMTAAFFGANSTQREQAFFNTGLYNIDGAGAYPPASAGLVEFTGREADRGRFRAPSLRNIAVTGPYMHDGSVATLEEVIAIYAAGGREVKDGLYAGDGRANPYKDPLVLGFTLSPEEELDLLEFLESLTDEVFLTDPLLGPPG
jgi:cytochrome c peroxidase